MTQGLMRTKLVVIRHPFVRSVLRLRQAVEQIGIKHFVPKALVKSFDIRVLIRTPLGTEVSIFTLSPKKGSLRLDAGLGRESLKA